MSAGSSVVAGCSMGDAGAAAAAMGVAAAVLRAALAEVVPHLMDGPDCARLAEELAATEKACAGVRLIAAARAVESGAHHAFGFRDGAAWLARQSGSTGNQARRDLEVAGRLVDCRTTREALLAGEISRDQAEEVVRTEAEVHGVEEELLDLARTSDLSKLRDAARQIRLTRTPVKKLHEEQHQARSFRHWRDRLGMICFTGSLTPEVGVPLINRLEQAAAQIRREAAAAQPDQPLERWEAYAADAFAQMCCPSTKEKRSPRAEVVIVCDLFAWRRGHTHPGEVCHVIGGGPLPVDLAHDLCEDAFIKAVLYEGTDIRTIRHFGRHLPAELRTALDLGPVPEFTGRQCAECGRRWGLEYDHIDPIGHQGPTSYDNLQALCWADHQAKTERDREAGLIRDRPGRPPDS